MPVNSRDVSNLRHLITVEQPTESTGDAVVTWAPLATLWMDMRALGDKEYQFSSRYHTEMVAAARFDPPRLRLGLGPRRFGVVAIQDPDGRRRELALQVTEIP